MVYRAEFRNFKAVTAVVLLGIAVVMADAVQSRDLRLVFLGTFMAGAFLWVRFRVQLVLTDEYLEYVGPVFRRRVPWAKITHERSVLAAGYPTDRWFGPSVYEFGTSDGVTRVTFLFFRGGALNEVRARAKAHSTKR